MRGKRLLGFAVTAVALGLAAVASADIAVVTVIADPAGPGTWEARVRCWGDAGIGEPASSHGFSDFILEEISGADTSTNVSPQSSWTVGFDTTEAGFAWWRGDGSNGVGITAAQPALYGTTPDPNMDYAVFQKIGIEDSNWAPPAGAAGNPVSWSADTLVASGDYSGTLATDFSTVGLMAFSVLPDNGGGAWEGPTEPAESTVNAIISQVMTGAGNRGGQDGWTADTAMAIEAAGIPVNLPSNMGSPSPDANTPAVAKVSLNVKAPGTEVVLNSDQDLAALELNFGDPNGTHGIDMNNPLSITPNVLRIYAPDATARADLELALWDAIVNADPDANDGVYDPGLDTDHPGAVIGLTDKGTDEAGGEFVKVRAVLKGDADCDGLNALSDLQAAVASWQETTNLTWDRGDFDNSGLVDLGDLQTVVARWQQTYGPEPGTMVLLGLGAVGVLLRRRRRIK